MSEKYILSLKSQEKKLFEFFTKILTDKEMRKLAELIEVNLLLEAECNK